MIFIKGNFPSFKNSKQMTRSGFLIMSKTVRKYLKEYEYQWEIDGENRYVFWEEAIHCKSPLIIGMHFIRGTRHKYDWVNMVQGVQDLMVKHEWISDDNTEIMYPTPLLINGKYSSYNKEQPGVFIKLLNK